MEVYEQQAFYEMGLWQKQMVRKPTLLNNISKRVQDKVNSFIPEKIHKGITTAIKQMFKLVLFGAGFTTSKPRVEGTLAIREAVILEKINFYQKTAAAEGGLTGAGGILVGLADFPLLLGIKIKLLFEMASTYGFDVSDYRERLYILHVFQLAFCSDERRKEVYLGIQDWTNKSMQLPEDINEFDWRNFQQEYRDYIDLAKMAQLVPIIGAPVGAVVNYRLIKKLGKTAMNAYRLRWQDSHSLTR